MFSIIIPTYNRVDLISVAITSVINQTFKDFEIIIVDDASKDGTRDLILSFSDSRIKYIELKTNGGNAVARNIGIKNALFEWITFLDSDDSFEPEYLEVFNKTIRNSDKKFFFCGHRVKETNKIISESNWKPRSNEKGTFIKDLKIGTGCGIVIHKSCFQTIGLFDERLRVAVDTDFLIRLDQKYGHVVLPHILITINQHSGVRVRKNTAKLAEAYEIIVEKQKALIFNNKELILKWYYKLMWLHYHSGNISKGNKAFVVLKNYGLVTGKVLLLRLMFQLAPTSLAVRIHKMLA